MKTSQKGIDLIKKYESCKLTAYQNKGDVPTIGYGHTVGIDIGDEITQNEAEQLLTQDLVIFEWQLTYLIKYDAGLLVEQNEFDALISLIFNIGIGNFRKSKTFKALKSKDETEMIIQWLDFNKAGGRYLKGLYKRRADEIRLYFS